MLNCLHNALEEFITICVTREFISFYFSFLNLRAPLYILGENYENMKTMSFGMYGFIFLIYKDGVYYIQHHTYV